VPGFGSFEARLIKADWFHLDVPRHLPHHRRASLVKSLAAVGMRPVWAGLFTLKYDCLSFAQLLLNWLGVRRNFLDRWLRGRKAKATKGSSSIGSFVATALLARSLGVISLLVILVLGILGWGATITVRAVKEKSRELP
jgi:hypothetical protein